MDTKKPIYWVTGNYFQCRKNWLDLCIKLNQPNVEMLDCGANSQNADKNNRQATAGDVVRFLKHRDIFDPRPRILKLKGLPEDYVLIAEYLYLIDENNILYIDAPFGYRKSTNRFITAATSTLFKKIKAEGHLIDFGLDAKSNNAAIAWAESVIKECQREIERNALELLVGLKGRNLDQLYCEISKLCSYALKGKITQEHVQLCCSSTFLGQSWDLLDELCLVNTDKALEYLQGFYGSAGGLPGTSFRGDVEILLGFMLKYFRLLLHAKDVCGATVNYSAISKACAEFKKPPKTENKPESSKTEIVEWKEEYFDKMFINVNVNKSSFQTALKWSKQKIYRIVKMVQDVRFALRSSKTSSEVNRAETQLLLDGLALFICGKIKPEATRAFCMTSFELIEDRV